MFHTVSVAISPHRYWGSPNMVEMVYVVSRKDESLREITVQINPTSIPHLTFSLKYAARNFSSLLSFKPFPSHVLNVRSWKLRLVEERIMVTISSTDRLDLHWSTRSPPIDSISIVLCKDLLLPLQKETPAQLDEKRLSGSGILRGLLPCLCYIFCVTIYQPSKSVTKTMKIKNKKRKVKKL